jgi:hypothetical protein
MQDTCEQVQDSIACEVCGRIFVRVLREAEDAFFIDGVEVDVDEFHRLMRLAISLEAAEWIG